MSRRGKETISRSSSRGGSGSRGRSRGRSMQARRQEAGGDVLLVAETVLATTG